MAKIRVRGPVCLQGDVTVGGSKNSLSAVLPALCLQDTGSIGTIENVPDIEDVRSFQSIFRELGMELTYDCQEKRITVTGSINNTEISKESAGKIRASNLFLGALTASQGAARIPFPGGDRLGGRPQDIHLYVLEKFGIQVEVDCETVVCQARQFPLQGQNIFLRYPSVGATENAILLASKAKGETYIYNAACEPEIIDMVIVLNGMGARISGAGTPVIHVRGVDRLQGIRHELIPDRLECATYMLAFAMTGGKGRVLGVIPEHNFAAISILRDCGVRIENRDDVIEVDASGRIFDKLNIHALPYPGVATDIQPLFSALSVLCHGRSVIRDSVFPNRFWQAGQFEKMGIKLEQKNDQLEIEGPQCIFPAEVDGGDIRTTMCLVLAGLAAEGDTIVDGYEHIRRGYENFAGKLKSLGANLAILPD